MTCSMLLSLWRLYGNPFFQMSSDTSFPRYWPSLFKMFAAILKHPALNWGYAMKVFFLDSAKSLSTVFTQEACEVMSLASYSHLQEDQRLT